MTAYDSECVYYDDDDIKDIYANFPQDAGSFTFLRVLHADNIVSVLTEIHASELKHSGYKKELEYAQRQYQGATRDFVQKFCSMCPTCHVS